MHDTFLDVIGSNSATFLNKDAILLMFNTMFDYIQNTFVERNYLYNEGINVN